MKAAEGKLIGQLIHQLDNAQKERDSLKAQLRKAELELSFLRKLTSSASIAPGQRTFTMDQVHTLTVEAVAGVNLNFDKNALEQQFKAGWDTAFWVFEEYLDPILRELIRLNSLIGQIMGIAFAGFGNIPKEQIKEIDAQLMASVSRLDHDIGRAVHEGVVSPDLVNMDTARAIYQASKRYYTGQDPDGTELREMAIEIHTVHARLLEIRQEFAPGAKKQAALALLDDLIVQERGKGGTHQEVAQRVLSTLKASNAPIRVEACSILEDKPYNKRAAFIKTRYNRRAKG